MGKRVSIALIAAGLVMIAAGWWHGDPSLVFSKAMRICLECIGIG